MSIVGIAEGINLYLHDSFEVIVEILKMKKVYCFL